MKLGYKKMAAFLRLCVEKFQIGVFLACVSLVLPTYVVCGILSFVQ